MKNEKKLYDIVFRFNNKNHCYANHKDPRNQINLTHFTEIFDLCVGKSQLELS